MSIRTYRAETSRPKDPIATPAQGLKDLLSANVNPAPSQFEIKVLRTAHADDDDSKWDEYCAQLKTKFVRALGSYFMEPYMRWSHDHGQVMAQMEYLFQREELSDLWKCIYSLVERETQKLLEGFLSSDTKSPVYVAELFIFIGRTWKVKVSKLLTRLTWFDGRYLSPQYGTTAEKCLSQIFVSAFLCDQGVLHRIQTIMAKLMREARLGTQTALASLVSIVETYESTGNGSCRADFREVVVSAMKKMAITEACQALAPSFVFQNTRSKPVLSVWYARFLEWNDSEQILWKSIGSSGKFYAAVFDEIKDCVVNDLFGTVLCKYFPLSLVSGDIKAANDIYGLCSNNAAAAINKSTSQFAVEYANAAERIFVTDLLGKGLFLVALEELVSASSERTQTSRLLHTLWDGIAGVVETLPQALARACAFYLRECHNQPPVVLERLGLISNILESLKDTDPFYIELSDVLSSVWLTDALSSSVDRCRNDAAILTKVFGEERTYPIIVKASDIHGQSTYHSLYEQTALLKRPADDTVPFSTIVDNVVILAGEQWPGKFKGESCESITFLGLKGPSTALADLYTDMFPKHKLQWYPDLSVCKVYLSGIEDPLTCTMTQLIILERVMSSGSQTLEKLSENIPLPKNTISRAVGDLTESDVLTLHATADRDAAHHKVTFNYDYIRGPNPT